MCLKVPIFVFSARFVDTKNIFHCKLLTRCVLGLDVMFITILNKACIVASNKDLVCNLYQFVSIIYSAY